MDHFATALIAMISYVESRDVPDDIADDDVTALEEVFFHLRQCSDADRERIVAAVTQSAADSSDPRHQQSMTAIIENLLP